MDPRAERAQQLYWLVYGSDHVPRPWHSGELVEMAQLHEEIARDRLGRGDATGWVDLYAAATAWGDAERLEQARALLSEARQWARRFPEMQEDIDREILDFEGWVDEKYPLITVPAPVHHNSSRGVDLLAVPRIGQRDPSMPEDPRR